MSGNTSPITCAQPGMPRNGNMKPESRIEGRKKKNVICIACIWLLASVEKVKPIARLAAMKRISTASRSARLPTIGTSKRNLAADEDHHDLHVADDDVGHDLAEHHLERAHRRREQVLHGAALALAGHGDARSSSPWSS